MLAGIQAWRWEGTLARSIIAGQHLKEQRVEPRDTRRRRHHHANYIF
jgi:hypothetical protein